MLNFLAFFLIPAYTLLFPHDTHWFTSNFSVIAAMPDQWLWFVIWGVLVAGYSAAVLGKIIRTLPRRPMAWTLLILALVLLSQALLIPYLPALYPFFAFLHVVYAFLACLLLSACVLLVVRRLWRENPALYGRYFRWCAAIAAVSALLFALTGIITSALEIFFVIAMTLLLRRLWLDRRGELTGR